MASSANTSPEKVPLASNRSSNSLGNVHDASSRSLPRHQSIPQQQQQSSPSPRRRRHESRSPRPAAAAQLESVADSSSSSRGEGLQQRRRRHSPRPAAAAQLESSSSRGEDLQNKRVAPTLLYEAGLAAIAVSAVKGCAGDGATLSTSRLSLDLEEEDMSPVLQPSGAIAQVEEAVKL